MSVTHFLRQAHAYSSFPKLSRRRTQYSTKWAYGAILIQTTTTDKELAEQGLEFDPRIHIKYQAR